ncbi:CpsD/CapB family tyrosine-protein kinase [Clostridium aestuarii]|uniref:non-specific protein-tyrosine kinase n=1 Tax=Clostridium aestuarii TaxID=338193 RepID=A0ABT4D2U8_9CLOT|nr:CpsD/CapB family tyrosine-protein kinase [Clostridium aestuarii]
MLILERDPKSVASEAFRTLRTNLQYSSFDNELKTILVTSAGPGEGKSTTAANLAISMVQSDKKVLIIDCDLRKPTVHKKFKLSNAYGLSNYLVGEISLNQAVKQYSDNLYILTSGTKPPNPAEMVSSKRMKDFLETAKKEFDHIIIDSPPVIAVTDAQVLSTLVDGVLLVIASGTTEKEIALRAKELLLKVKANILGAILTKADFNSGKGYGYGYYYYYGDDDNKSKKKRRNKKTKGRTKRDEGYPLSHTT